MKQQTDWLAVQMEIDAQRRRFELAAWEGIAKMERREQFWRGVGLVVGGILVMLANKERTKEGE